MLTTLKGEGGNDTLDGGADADILNGGAGNDTYIVDNTADSITEAANSGTDTVKSSVREDRGEAMDTTACDQEIVKQVILQYAQFRPSHGNIRLDTVFDETQGRYALMQVGWDRGRPVRGNLIYVTLYNGKIWVEYDGMEPGITQDLIERGIPEERIVLAFLPEQRVAAIA